MRGGSRQRGAIPRDVSVIGIDDITLAGLLHPPLTTVHQPIEELSEAAVDLLIKRVSGHEAGATATYCDGAIPHRARVHNLRREKKCLNSTRTRSYW